MHVRYDVAGCNARRSSKGSTGISIVPAGGDNPGMSEIIALKSRALVCMLQLSAQLVDIAFCPVCMVLKIGIEVYSYHSILPDCLIV